MKPRITTEPGALSVAAFCQWAGEQPTQNKLTGNRDKEPVLILRSEDLWGEINAVADLITPDLIARLREMGFTEHVASNYAVEQIVAMLLNYLLEDLRVYRNEEGFELDLGSGEVQVQLTEEPISPWSRAEDAIREMEEDERAEFRAWLDGKDVFYA